MLVKAKLIKRVTDDGMMEIADQVPLGTEYHVDLTTRRIREGYNYVHNVSWSRELIQADTGSWLPTELLEIADAATQHE